MANIKLRSSLLDSESSKIARQKLEYMTTDTKYNTESTYSANIDQYPDNLIPFVDKHMNYLDAHPSLDPVLYVANVRLKTRVWQPQF